MMEKDVCEFLKVQPAPMNREEIGMLEMLTTNLQEHCKEIMVENRRDKVKEFLEMDLDKILSTRDAKKIDSDSDSSTESAYST